MFFCKWRSYKLPKCETLIADIEVQFTQLLHSSPLDTLQLRKVLYEIVGALSPPRVKPESNEETVPMDDLAAARLKKASRVQRRVHELVAQGLLLWRDCL